MTPASRTGGRLRIGPRVLAVAAIVAIGTLQGALPATAQTPEPPRTAAEVVYDGSPDGVDGAVYRLYRAFFLREPDTDGLVHWLVHVRFKSYPLAAVAEDFAGSAEFRSRYGALDDGGFVDLVYRNVLDREPDAEGRAWWLGHLSQGMPRGHLMLHFSESAEYAKAVGTGPFGGRDFRGPARPAPPAPEGSYRFLDLGTGHPGPISWPRCRPVYVVANPAGIPVDEHDDFEAMLEHALSEISTATGQHWVYVGRTAYRATDRSSIQVVPGVVSISFMSAPDPEDSASAWASRATLRNPLTGGIAYLSGVVNLNARRLVDNMGGEVTPLVATTLMHELGHVAGLDHVDDTTQLMAPVYQLPEDAVYEEYRQGDLAGLAQVGSVTTAC